MLSQLTAPVSVPEWWPHNARDVEATVKVVQNVHARLQARVTPSLCQTPCAVPRLHACTLPPPAKLACLHSQEGAQLLLKRLVVLKVRFWEGERVKSERAALGIVSNVSSKSALLRLL